jgi:hypothetical protein
MSGFIVAYRDAAEHPLFKGHADRLGAWLWLLMKAAWKPTKFDVNGKVVTVERGQLSVSIRHLGEAWGWPKSTTERFLTRLKTETMIETHSGTGRLLITICNYDKYQDVSDINGTASGTQVGTGAGQERDTKEQGNKGTRDKEPNGSSSQRTSARKPKTEKTSPIPLPDDWEPQPFGLGTKSRGIVDGWPPGRLEFQADRFRANHRSRGSKFSDWQAAWGTWVLNTVEFGKSNNGTGFSQNGFGGPEPITHNPMFQAHLELQAERVGGKATVFEPDAGDWP